MLFLFIAIYIMRMTKKKLLIVHNQVVDLWKHLILRLDEYQMKKFDEKTFGLSF